MNDFKSYRQHNQIDCGPACLRMIAKHHGRNYTLETLRKKSGINREGVSLLGMSEAAEDIGFRTVGGKLTWDQLKNEATLPCVVYWGQEHFAVVYKIKEGQRVLVRFSGYPFKEFGSVTGRVSYLSEFPVKDSVFVAKVKFPNGFITN